MRRALSKVLKFKMSETEALVSNFELAPTQNWLPRAIGQPLVSSPGPKAEPRNALWRANKNAYRTKKIMLLSIIIYPLNLENIFIICLQLGHSMTYMSPQKLTTLSNITAHSSSARGQPS